MPRRHLRLDLDNLHNKQEQTPIDSVSPSPYSDIPSTPSKLATSPLGFTPPPGLAIPETPLTVKSNRELPHPASYHSSSSEASTDYHFPNSFSSPNSFNLSSSSSSNPPPCPKPSSTRKHGFFQRIELTPAIPIVSRQAATPRAFFSSSAQEESTPVSREKWSSSLDSPDSECAVLNAQADSITRAYPLGYKGFLETHSEELCSVETYRILGINSFADGGLSTLGIFAESITELNFTYRIFIQKSAIAKIISVLNSIPNQKLREELLEYDRTMSFLLHKCPQQWQQYCTYMRNILPKHPGPGQDFHSIFEAICNEDTFNSIFSTKRKRDKAKPAFDALKQAFIIYEETFKRDQDYVKRKNELLATSAELYSKRDSLEIEQKECGVINPGHAGRMYDLEEKMKAVSRKWDELEQQKEQEDLKLVSKFSLYNDLSDNFLKILRELDREEDGEIKRYLHTKGDNINLPILDKTKEIDLESLINVCKYFFGSLRISGPRFYGIASKEDNFFYLNTDYKKKISHIKRESKFKRFMQDQHKCYRQGLLETVLRKALDYITTNTGIPLDNAAIFKHARQCEEQKTLFNYLIIPEDFFNMAMNATLQQIKEHLYFRPPILVPPEQSDYDSRLSLEAPSKKEEKISIERTQHNAGYKSTLFFAREMKQEPLEKTVKTPRKSEPRDSPVPGFTSKHW